MPASHPDASEQRFNLVARAITDAIYDWEIGTGQLWLSDSFFSVFGYTRAGMPEGIGGWEDRIHPDDAVRVSETLQAAVDSDVDAYECEYRFLRGDGGEACVLDRGYLQRDANGVAVRMVGGMIDLTDRRRVASDLRLLRRAVEIIGDGIVVLDARLADTPVVYTNPAFTRITGYSAEEAHGRNCRYLLGADDAQEAVGTLRTAALGGREAHALVRSYRKDGELFWNDFTLTPLRDDDGAVTHYLGIMCDATARQRNEEQLAYRASHDPLTALPNRRTALDRLAQLLPLATRRGHDVAVLFIDLDDFKLVNDNLGHAAGDHVLRIVAERLSALVDQDMGIGRFGGDEFVLVSELPRGGDAEASLLARVTQAVSRPIEVEGILHTITPSIGYSIHPEDGDNAEHLLMRADMAMYQAKRAGRNRAMRYEPSFNASVSQRLQLTTRLREALEQKEFMLEFQPLFARDGTPTGLEALVRWEHPQRGTLPPSEFIGICEESGLIVELGRRVLAEAARCHAELARLGFGHLRIAVNVSAAQFAGDLHGDVLRAVTMHGVPPHVLELELTESVIMASPERAIATMRRLNGLGIGIAVDDFGTGYSSLAYLKQLPISRLKIDRSFVSALATDANDRSICGSIIAMAKSLGLATTAEGVETREQLRWLAAQGVDEVQGYLFGRPASFDDCVARLRAPAPPAVA